MSRRFRRRKLPQEPVNISVRGMSHEGRGVGDQEGKVCFVHGALADEVVQARYVSKRSSFDELTTLEVIERSPERVEPPCQYAQICGGCSLQHWDSASQLRFKESVLLEKLAHEPAVELDAVERLAPLEGPTEGYRRKARLAVRVVSKKGGALVGFRESHSSFITDMQDCKVLAPAVARLIPGLRGLIDQLEMAREIPQIEVAVGEGSRQELAGDRVALVVRHLQPLGDADKEKLSQFASEQGIEFYLQPKGPDTIHPLSADSREASQPPNQDDSPAQGEIAERLYYHLPDYGLRLGFHPSDFTQVNAEINRDMIKQALKLLALNADDRVLDLFCGLGNFSLPIARSAAAVVGVEGSAAMVARAEENARRNDIANASFYAADLTEGFNGAAWSQQDFNKILLDPPRSGAIELLPDILASSARTLVYVSCNPATLARDAGALVAGGFELKSAGVMDMFPHTSHVESMALFSR